MKRRPANFKVFMISSILTLLLCAVSVNVFIVSALGYHVNSKTDFSKLAKGVRTLERQIDSNRGSILDRNGELIAHDVVSYKMIAILDASIPAKPGEIAYVDDVEKTANAFNKILGMPYEFAKKRLSQENFQVEFGGYGKSVSKDQKEALEAEGLNGLRFEPIITRSYPLGKFASPIVGYARYQTDTSKMHGEMGLEMNYDEYLQGVDGNELYQVDINNYPLAGTEHIRTNPIKGNDIQLTLDRGIQQSVELALQGLLEDEQVNAKEAWGIVLDVETGKILAWGDAPTFDPNILEIDSYMVKGSQYAYEPGSTMKTFTVASAIEAGGFNANATFDSNPFYVGVKDGKPVRVSGDARSIHTIRNAFNRTYGMMTYADGYVESSNVMIADLLSYHLDPNRFMEDLEKLGFYEAVDTDAIPEVSGTKMWQNPLDKLSNGFGQSSTVTMLQVAQAYTSVMTDGTVKKPYLIDKIVSESGDIVYEGKTENLGRVYSDETAKQVQALMRRVVADNGPATRFDLEEVEVLGKTGTAQMIDPNGSTPGYSSTQFIYSTALGIPAAKPKVLFYYGYVAREGHNLNAAAQYVKTVLLKAGSTYDMLHNSNDTIVDTTKPVQLENYVNQSTESAVKALKKRGLQPVVLGDGKRVLQQYPSGPNTLIYDQKVLLYTSESHLVMPDVSGYSSKEMRQLSSLLGLKLKLNGKGFVVSQSIPPGSALEKDMSLEVTLE